MEILKLLWSWQSIAIAVIALYHKELRLLLGRLAKSTKAKIGGIELELPPDLSAKPDGAIDVLESRTYVREVVHLDGKHFKKCSFEDVDLVFSGNGAVGLTGCSFTDVRWRFEGAAADTVKFLGGLYSGAGDGGQQLVESVFQQIRAGANQPAAKEPRP